MGTMYGKKPLNLLEIKGVFVLSNGMYCVYGQNTKGICVDVYKDETRKDLISMQHGIVTNTGLNANLLKDLMESMIDEF
jgi:hypothetical protein